MFAAADSRSFRRAELSLKRIGGNLVSFKTIERVTQDIGRELEALRDGEADDAAGLAHVPEVPPQLAVVQCDGGRIRTRQPGHGPGVHEESWRETKNACLLRMTHQTFAEDPHPELPAAFRDPKHVAKIAEKEAPPPAVIAETLLESISEEAESAPEKMPDWRPKRLVRTCLSSMAKSDDFGGQMARETQRRRFDKAPFRAFLGDGLPWNWTIWRIHYKSYVPILDFIHVLSYLYAAALKLADNYAASWTKYLDLATRCWQGRAADAIAELGTWLTDRGTTLDETLPDDDPRRPVQDAWRYLTNNLERLDYPRYRCQGLPVTTALMESLVKEINYRVKGTEMFWNDPDGAEAILQVKAAALCDDDRLAEYLAARPGQPFVRPPVMAA